MLGVSESRIAGSQGPDFSVPRLHLNFKCLPLNILTAIEAKHRASYFNEWHFGIAGSGEPLKDISTSNAPKCRAPCLKVNFLGVIEIPRPFRSGWDKGRGKWGSDLATFLCVIFAIFYRKIPKLVMPIPSHWGKAEKESDDRLTCHSGRLYPRDKTQFKTFFISHPILGQLRGVQLKLSNFLVQWRPNAFAPALIPLLYFCTNFKVYGIHCFSGVNFRMKTQQVHIWYEFWISVIK